MSETDEPCTAEVWSWDHFTPNQVDPYWIRCTLAGAHEEHEDENTGLRWNAIDMAAVTQDSPARAHPTPGSGSPF